MAKDARIPGYLYINENAVRQALVAGSLYVNEIGFNVYSDAITETATASDSFADVRPQGLIPGWCYYGVGNYRQGLLPGVGYVSETGRFISRAVDVSAVTAISDIGTASDSNDAAAVMINNTTSDSATATDDMTPNTVFIDGVSESASASDALSASFTFTDAVSETVTGSDAIDEAVTFNDTLDESVIASDDLTHAIDFNDSVTETVTASMTYENKIFSGQQFIPGHAYISETGVRDALLPGCAYINETNHIIVYPVTVSAVTSTSESATASDSQAAVLSASVATSESMVGFDQQATGNVVSEFPLETATATDSFGAQTVYFQQRLGAVYLSSGVARDALIPGIAYANDGGRSALGAEQVSITFAASITETVTASDQFATYPGAPQTLIPGWCFYQGGSVRQGLIPGVGYISEAGRTFSIPGAFVIYNFPMPETVTASDALAALATMNPALLERVIGYDSVPVPAQGTAKFGALMFGGAAFASSGNAVASGVMPATVNFQAAVSDSASSTDANSIGGGSHFTDAFTETVTAADSYTVLHVRRAPDRIFLAVASRVNFIASGL